MPMKPTPTMPIRVMVVFPLLSASRFGLSYPGTTAKSNLAEYLAQA
jgi:hypothetical protein